MAAIKPDSQRISAFLKTLAQEDWIQRTERSWWPQFVLHYTDITNAAEILKRGCIYSRALAEQYDALHVSSGSAAVLDNTRSDIKQSVRLYFRPRTPTQYYAEGIYSAESLKRSRFPDAHCPVPVFFVFDAARILSRQDCRFSDGNLGSANAQLFSTARELEQLPWHQIYHNSRVYPAEKQSIVFRRCAEVIVPNQLKLDALRYIYCRSSAERETLLCLLPERIRQRFERSIVSSARADLFFRRQTFVETVRMVSDQVTFDFSPDTASPGPFHLHVVLDAPNHQRRLDKPDFVLPPDRKLMVNLSARRTMYTIHFSLDDHIAYAGTYRETSSPL